MPNELCNQIIPLHNFMSAMGITILTVDEVEADDVIGTLARQAAHNQYHVLISTNDKDMAQLVSSRIFLIDASSRVILNAKDIQSKFGVPPQLIIDYLSLVGDAADNIPGIPGIGKKIAKVLLQNIGGLHILYNQLSKIHTLNIRGSEKIINKLIQHCDTAFLSYRLAAIKTDVITNITLDQITLKTQNTNDLILFCQKYNFNHWLKNLYHNGIF